MQIVPYLPVYIASCWGKVLWVKLSTVILIRWNFKNSTHEPTYKGFLWWQFSLLGFFSPWWRKASYLSSWLSRHFLKQILILLILKFWNCQKNDGGALRSCDFSSVSYFSESSTPISTTSFLLLPPNSQQSLRTGSFYWNLLSFWL